MDAGSLERREWIGAALGRYQGPLTRYAVQITGDLERARDVVQDTFLRLCTQDPARLRDHLAPWLFKVCRNRALDVVRKEKRMSPLEDDRLEACPSAEPSVTKCLEKEQDLSHIFSVLKTLPPRQREVLQLKFQNDLSYREIAEVTKLSVSNVGFLIHTGLGAIRKQIARAASAGTVALRRAQ